MLLKHLSLQNFRSYTKSAFDFNQGTTLIVGANTSGKTNLIEAIFLLSSGTSFRADKDIEMIQFHEEVARLIGEIEGLTGATKLEVVLPREELKRYLVNGVSKRRVDFAGQLATVLFSPLDLDIIVDSPSLRREFLDSILIQVDRAYRLALITYGKGLRQRNALLDKARETGMRDEKNFVYWDSLLIENGQVITKKREELIGFFNKEEKEIFDFTVFYDQSVISKERLLQYKEAEMGSGVTLVGPHRDDFAVHMFNNKLQATHNVRLFGSRGQQRLVILQLKLLALSFIEKAIGERPILLLDDIFSELDSEHIKHVLNLINKQQTIITTTHEEFVPQSLLKKMNVIKLG